MILSSTRRVITATLIGALSIGCGGGSNNDQGAGFTFTNFNALRNNECQAELFISSTSMVLSSGPSSETLSNGEFVCYTVQNNLQSRFVRVDRVFIEYYIEGAREQPPATSLATSGVLGPVGGGPAFTGDPANFTPGSAPTTTLPPGFQSANRLIKALAIVPPSITQWLALHRDQIPEPPFNMDAIVTVAGETSAGDRIETNPASITVTVLQDNPIRSPATPSAAAAEDGELEPEEE